MIFLTRETCYPQLILYIVRITTGCCTKPPQSFCDQYSLPLPVCGTKSSCLLAASRIESPYAFYVQLHHAGGCVRPLLPVPLHGHGTITSCLVVASNLLAPVVMAFMIAKKPPYSLCSFHYHCLAVVLT